MGVLNLGDIVLYNQAADQEPFHNGTRVHPAIITRIWSEDCVNLLVMYDSGYPAPVTSVSRVPMTGVDDNSCFDVVGKE